MKKFNIYFTDENDTVIYTSVAEYIDESKTIENAKNFAREMLANMPKAVRFAVESPRQLFECHKCNQVFEDDGEGQHPICHNCKNEDEKEALLKED